MDRHDAYSMCQRYMNRYVKINTSSGAKYSGYIGNLDRNTVYVAIPLADSQASSSSRNGRRPCYPVTPAYYPPYYPAYGAAPYAAPYPYARRRGFRWVAIPLAFLVGVAVGTIID